MSRDPIFRRKRSLGARLGRAALGLIGVLAALVIGFVAYQSTSLPSLEGRLTLPALRAPVSLIRDRSGVPHIFAASMHDAYVALGYAHAQDRLAQMELMRRAGQGRLAEAAGSAALPSDRFLRTLGVYRLAERDYAVLGSEVRAALDAYAAGVNAYLAGHEGAWPPELLLGGVTPEPWKPADSLVWARMMGLLLGGNFRAQATRAALTERLPKPLLDLLLSLDQPADYTTLSLSTGTGAMLTRLADAVPEIIRPTLASNAWAVAAARSASGHAMLASDPHLGLSAPSLWYLARIDTPELRLVGATAPGVPFHVLGQNDRIAWGLTTTGAATQDLFLERPDPTDVTKYQTPQGPAPFETRIETIKIRFGDPETLMVRSTRHGPVVSDLPAIDKKDLPDGTLAALSSTALAPESRSAEALYRLNRARDWPQFLDALSLHVAPVQNFMFASRDGDIGLITAGHVPIRTDSNGLFPGTGWDGAGDWTGFIRFAELPQRHDPEGGALVNANNRVVADDYPHSITPLWDAPFRAERAAELLADRHDLSLNDMARFQVDTLSPVARRLVPRLAALSPNAPAAIKARDLIAGWDGRMDRDRPEPLIFAATLASFDRLAIEPRLGKAAGLVAYDRRLTLRLLETDTDWCNDDTTGAKRSCASVLAIAFDDAVAALAKAYGDDPAGWRWGAAHEARLVHLLFGRVPVLAALTNLSLPMSGGDDTLSRAAYTVAADDTRFDAVHGAGYRAVYDLGDPARSLMIISTGQSGNAMSPHWGDLVATWRDGGMIRLAGTADALLASGGKRLVLSP